MKTTHAIGLAVALVVAAAGCGRRPTGPAEQTGASNMATPMGAAVQTWTATLAGSNEVPPVDTMATGTATFTRAENAMRIDYTVNVQSISDVTEAHLHLGKPGENGDVVVWLYPEGPPPSTIKGPLNGVLAQGSIDAARLTGPMEGKTIQDLIDKMDAGEIYVNVHTEAHPDGEIRGQVEVEGGAQQAQPMGAPAEASPAATPNSME